MREAVGATGPQRSFFPSDRHSVPPTQAQHYRGKRRHRIACVTLPAMRKVMIVIVSLSTLSCGKLNEITAPDLGGPPPDPTATLTRVQTEVFTPTCAIIGCHGTFGTQEQLVMTAGTSYANTVERPSLQMPQLMRVKPFDPANSYVYRKVTGVGITGDRMPQASPPLSDAQITLIRDWIRRGAPND